MPVLTEPELQKAIASREIGAVAIDTSVIDHYQTNLEFKLLRSLEQFKRTGISVLLSEVVLGEVNSHLVRKNNETKNKLHTALNQFSRNWKLDPKRLEAVSKELAVDEPAAFAAAQINAYVSHIGAEIVKAEGNVSLSDILSMYFSNSAPFSTAEKKKNEFPDAFALCSLEAWGRNKNKKVIVVSRDSDWQKYAEQSDWLVHIRDLPVCLNLFNEDEVFIASRVMKMLIDGQATGVLKAIRDAVEQEVESTDFHVEADSPFYFSASAAYARFLDLTIEDGEPLVIEADAEVLTIQVRAQAQIEANADFDFTMRDGIDRDYVSIGSSSHSVRHWIDVSAFVTVDRKFDGEPGLVDLDIDIGFPTVEFGIVEPVWDAD